MKIRTTFLADESSDNMDDEWDSIQYHLEDMGLDIEVIHKVHRIDQIGEPDLLVVDYGGLSIGGAYDVARWHMKAATQWAVDHPGRLMLVWSQFTQFLYEDVLEDFRGELDNIVPFYEGDYDEATKKTEEKIKAWFQ